MSSRPHTHAGTRASINGAHQTSQTCSASPEVVGAVRQLVSAAVSYLRSYPHCSADEVLAQLPSNDDNFHRYELVRHIQSLISTQLAPLLTRRLATISLEGDGHSSAAQLTDDILASTLYKRLCHNLSSEIRDAVSEMLDDSADLSLSPAHTHHPSSLLTPSSFSQATQYYSLDTSSDLSRLLSQTALWSPDQLLAITQDLHPSQPLQVRREAMHHLLQFPMGDLVAMETWSQLKPVLSDALMDHDTTLAGMSLTLHSRLFFTHSSAASHEAFLSLVRQLHGFFQGHEGMTVTVAMGIDPADDRCLALLQRMNLLNQFQRDITSYWIRYNQQTVDDIIHATFDLLLLGYDAPAQLRSIHYLCVLDPLAQWFRQWTHSEYSRSIVLTSLRDRPDLLQSVVSHVMSCRVRHHGHSISKHTDSGYYNEASLHYLYLCHSVSVIEKLMVWEGGRALFPVTTDRGQTVTISDILVHLLQILYSLPPPSTPLTSPNISDHAHHVISLDPALLIINVFQELVSGSSRSIQLLTQEEVLSELLSPIQSLMNKKGEGPEVAMEILLWVGQIVGRLASSERGCDTLLGSRSVLLAVLTEFVCHCLLTDTPPVTPVVMTTWLFVCRQLYKTGKGLVAMEKYFLHKHIANRILKIGVEEIKGQLSVCGYQLGHELVDNLLSLCWSPRGVLVLGSLPRLLELCVEYMWDRIRQGSQVSWCDRYGYGALVSQLATTFIGATHLVRCGIVSSLLEEVWQWIEGEGEEMEDRKDVRLVLPWTHPLETHEHAVNKAMTALTNVIANFPIMYELLNSDPSTSETTPTMVSRLLRQLGGHSHVPGYPDTWLISARVVSIAMTSLDTLLLLQDKFNLSEQLLWQQRAVAMENGSVAVDECTVICNRMLVAAYMVGGPAERLLPPLSLSQPNEEYPWSLFTDYPPPSCYHGNVSWTMELNKDNALYRLVSSDHAPSEVREGAWLHEVRDVYCKEVKRRGSLPNDLVAMLLEGVTTQHPPETIVAMATGPAPSLTGVQMVISYGQRLGLLSPSHTPTHLTSLITQLPRDRAPGFDWLIGIVFIMTRGNSEKTLSITSQLPWQQCIQRVDSVYSNIYHCVEIILQAEAPQLLAAFQLSGCVAGQLVSLWLRQWFLNCLNWPQILLYLATTVIMGTDYQVYWCVCCLRSMESTILLHSQRDDLLPHMLEYGALRVFHPSEWVDSMRRLETVYRNTVLNILEHMTIT